VKLTLAYFTSRREPRFHWFCDSLCNQLSTEELAEIQVIAVDRHLWAITPEAGNTYWRRGDLMPLTDPTWHVESRREKFVAAVRGRFDLLHIPVKPNNYQGPFRLTTKDWFCAATTRNTGIMAAKHPYFVGVDDLSVLLPGFWPQVKHAASDGYCVAGMYCKKKQLVVENGEVKSFDPEWDAGRDTRWAHGSDSGIVKWHGGSVFGCSFGMPTELLLRINGFDELCSAEGGEDYCMGIRAERAGAQWWMNRNMLSFESEEAHHEEPSLPRERKLVSADRLPPGYESWPHVKPDERHYSDHVAVNRLRNELRTTTIAQWTNLRQAREEFQASQRALIPTGPTSDWRDGKPLSEL